jgi:hypothetical protein
VGVAVGVALSAKGGGGEWEQDGGWGAAPLARMGGGPQEPSAGPDALTGRPRRPPRRWVSGRPVLNGNSWRPRDQAEGARLPGVAKGRAQRRVRGSVAGGDPLSNPRATWAGEGRARRCLLPGLQAPSPKATGKPQSALGAAPGYGGQWLGRPGAGWAGAPNTHAQLHAAARLARRRHPQSAGPRCPGRCVFCFLASPDVFVAPRPPNRAASRRHQRGRSS